MQITRSALSSRSKKFRGCCDYERNPLRKPSRYPPGSGFALSRQSRCERVFLKGFLSIRFCIVTACKRRDYCQLICRVWVWIWQVFRHPSLVVQPELDLTISAVVRLSSYPGIPAPLIWQSKWPKFLKKRSEER